MRFVWIGFMKAGSEASQHILQQETAFLQQPYIRILSAGALRDEDGRRTGMMMIFETENRSTAEALVAGSPFKKAGLYEHYRLAEFRDEVG